MALRPRAYDPVFRVCLHLLTSFAIAAVLKSALIKGDETFQNASSEAESSSSVLENPDGLNQSDGNALQKIGVTKKAKKHPPIFDLHEPYMSGLTNALAEDDLEFYLDYYNEKNLVKEYDFDSVNLARRLSEAALAYNTPPRVFLEEMQDLISLQNRSRTEQDEGVTPEEVPMIPPGFLNENLFKRMTEGWKNEELKRLEKKYNVTSQCTGPDSITPTRLSLMFPQFLNFGQKPFAAPSNISTGLKSKEVVTVCDGDRPCFEQFLDYRVPSLFGRQEFGGMIPVTIFGEPDGRAIVGTHLYALYRNDQNDVVPFRTKLAMLKRRMRKNLLSDERRYRFLVNNDILHGNGTLLATSVRDAYNAVPNEFKDKIDWDLLVW